MSPGAFAEDVIGVVVLEVLNKSLSSPDEGRGRGNSGRRKTPCGPQCMRGQGTFW